MERKLAVITGADGGMGTEITRAMALAGYRVIMACCNREKAEAKKEWLVKETGNPDVEVMYIDLASLTSVADFAERLCARGERLALLMNNAGIGLNAPFAETSEAQFDELMNIQFKGPFFLTQRLLPLLQDGGRILNVSSGLARFALPGYAAYAAMKGAMEVLTRYQAKELGGRGISVNIIAPGAIETDFGGGEVRDNAEVNRHIAAQTALGRVGLPDDIGDAIAALLSDELAWMNAQRVEVSGGMFL